MRILAALVPALLLAACAVPSGPPPRPQTAAGGGSGQCFFVREANSFARAGGDAIHVRAGARRVHRLEAAGGCPEIDFAQAVGVIPRGAGSSIYPGNLAELMVQSPLRANRCLVTVGARLTPHQVAALPRNQRP